MTTPAPSRLSIGVPQLDALLGGGLLPGTLTVVVGSAGIGKTQLGLQFAHAGKMQEGRPGVIYDMASRGDSQSHEEYARRMFDWELTRGEPEAPLGLGDFFASKTLEADYLHVFEYSGRRVTRQDLDFDGWGDWQAEIARRLAASIAFFYGNFIRGARRVVIDGIEPIARASESIQLELFEYVYHQILRKDPEWVARDLFREHFRRHAEEVARWVYSPAEIGCVLLQTAHETTLENLIERPLDEGGLLANANTVIHMGKIREGHRFRRALYVSKHRGSPCPDEIIPYTIGESGIRLE